MGLVRVERNISLYNGKIYRVYVSQGNYLGSFKTLDEARSARDVYWSDKDRGNQRRVFIRGLTERLNKAVTESGIGLNELSRRTGIGTHTLRTYFNGEYNPKADNLAKLAIVLNVSTDWLLGISTKKRTILS